MQAIKLNATETFLADPDLKIEPDIVEFAALAHDLGHPPFGHNGEEALDCMMQDEGGFEGNAQTLHILTRVEKKAHNKPDHAPLGAFLDDRQDYRYGLDLTYRSLASIIKYDEEIPSRLAERTKKGVIKGYYSNDADIVRDIKKHVSGDPSINQFKTIECSIMDISDDIAYSTYDMEDCFKSGHLDPLKMISLDERIYEATANTINNRISKFYKDIENYKFHFLDAASVQNGLEIIFQDIFDMSDVDFEVINDPKIDQNKKKLLLARSAGATSSYVAQNGYARTQITSHYIQRFMDAVEFIPNSEHPELSQVRLEIETFKVVEIMKNVFFNYIILSPELQTFEYRGRDIIETIFKAIQDKGGERLLPNDYRHLCDEVRGPRRSRLICDFIAGMTDRYAWEFYGRIKGASSNSVYIPV